MYVNGCFTELYRQHLFDIGQQCIAIDTLLCVNSLQFPTLLPLTIYDTRQPTYC